MDQGASSALTRAQLRCHSRVLPLVAVVPDDRSGTRWLLAAKRVGITLFHREAAVAGAHEVFVDAASRHLGDEGLPDAGLVRPCRHRVSVMIPAVEVADDVNRRSIRRPDGEAGAAHAFDTIRMRPKLLIGTEEGALAEVINIAAGQFTHVGIVHF